MDKQYIDTVAKGRTLDISVIYLGVDADQRVGTVVELFLQRDDDALKVCFRFFFNVAGNLVGKITISSLFNDVIWCQYPIDCTWCEKVNWRQVISFDKKFTFNYRISVTSFQESTKQVVSSIPTTVSDKIISNVHRAYDYSGPFRFLHMQQNKQKLVLIVLCRDLKCLDLPFQCSCYPTQHRLHREQRTELVDNCNEETCSTDEEMQPCLYSNNSWP